MNATGGTSFHYHAQSWLYNPRDSKVHAESVRRYGANSIPKGATLEDWPVTYDELEPHYDHVEYKVGVSGRTGLIDDWRSRMAHLVPLTRSAAVTVTLSSVETRWGGPG